jgi:hypothetical protein
MVDATKPVSTSVERRALGLFAVLLAASLPIGLMFILSGAVTTGPGAKEFLVSLHLFVAQDMWTGPLLLVVLAVALIGSRSGGMGMRAFPPWSIGLVAALSVASVLVLRFVAFHNYNLTVDEFFPHFQAEIFRGGNLMAPLSDEAFALRNALQPYFTYVDVDHQLWAQHYRPVHAAILSLFPRGYEVACAHSILTGVTVLAISSIARRLFPERPGAPLLAACLLITSPQVLLTGASGFAFTTHLAFNTVWLALFLKGTWSAHVAAAVVSFFALGIHQVHVHAIYAFPFGIALLLGCFGNRWKAVPYMIAAAVGVPFWIMWPEIATWLQTGDASALPRSVREVEYLANYIDRSDGLGRLDRQFSTYFLVTNMWRFLLWMSPGLVLLVLVALVSPRRLGAVPVVAGLGVIFGIAVSHLMLSNQMLSIGSRYYHPFIGSLVVVSLAAYYRLADHPRLARTAVLLGLGGAIVLLPWRTWQVHQQVAPRAEIHRALVAMSAENIVIEPKPIWFALDFVRNDPYLRRGPFFYAPLDGAEIVTLSDDPIVWTTADDLVAMGLSRGTYLEPDITR